MFADLALLNGKIITVDEKESIVEAVAVKYGRILHVGFNEDVNEYVGDDTKIIDLKGER